MNVSKLRNSSAVDKVLGITAVDKALRGNLDSIEHAPVDKRLEETAPSSSITAESVRTYLRKISEHSSDEIDTLISDLRGLRERLVTDGTRIEQDVVDFAALNHSVVQLTEVVAESVAQVKTPPSQ